MATARSKAPRLDLVVVSGPDEGLRVRLEPPGPVPVGRSTRGLALGDPLVSIQHAELSWEDGSWRLRDVGSATGTRVRGAQLEPGQVQTVQVGDVIELGESQVRISRPQWVAVPLVAAAVLIVVASGAAAALALIQGPPGRADHSLTWHEPIRQGAAVAQKLELALPFLRQRGLDPSALRIARVTDFDVNGADEVWLKHGDDVYAVTFEEDGSWVELGSMPVSCIDGSRPGDNLLARGFPLQNCPGRSYSFVDGRYEVTRMEGVVAWVRETPPAAEGAPPGPSRIVPYTVTSRRPEKLAGFLAARGVSEPVAWLLCEGAFPELKAQVRTARGALRPLSYGCHTDLKVEGQVAGEVLAVAFTSAARDGLIDDLHRFFAGNADGLFASAEDRQRIAPWRAEPGFLKGGTRVEFEGLEHFFHPFANEGPLPSSSDPLLASPGAQAAPSALTATLLTKGVGRLDPPGCALFEVRTEDWSCASGCANTNTFLTVREVGCADPQVIMTVPYLGGVMDASTNGVEVRAVVDSTARPEGTEVWQTRVTYRLDRR